MQTPLELGDRAFDLSRPRPHRARHPVERAELVDDRALDPTDRIGLELDLPVGIEPLDRADQPEETVRDEILLVDVRRERRADAPRGELDERRVRQDQPVAQLLVAGTPVFLPERMRLASRLRGHEDRIRRGRAKPSFSGYGPRFPAEISHPEGEAGRCNADHDRSSTGGDRVHRKPAEGHSDRREEDRERATLHDAEATLGRATQGRGSIGRAPVSKTGGCRFESCRPCWSADSKSPSGDFESREAGWSADSKSPSGDFESRKPLKPGSLRLPCWSAAVKPRMGISRRENP